MPAPQHPALNRRTLLQAGSIGLLGLGMNHIAPLRAAAAGTLPSPTAKRVIYIFLSGGLSQHDSFDMKPAAPDDIRGEFRPIETTTPGIQICEHLPRLAQRSNSVGIVPLADASLQRALGRPSHHVDRAFRPSERIQSARSATGRLAVDRIGRRRGPSIEKQFTSGRGASRSTDPLVAARHSGAVCRNHGTAS